LDIVYHIDEVRDDSERIQNAADWVMHTFDLRRFTASVSIVDDPTIHRLNRQYLNHDWPTDVISFVFESQDQQVDGEVIASADTAAKTYRAAQWDVEDEILLYVVHGLLHLAGLDDVTEADRQRMRLEEMNCLLHLGVAVAKDHLDRWNSIMS
jgi:probable rRNA maturation factor